MALPPIARPPTLPLPPAQDARAAAQRAFFAAAMGRPAEPEPSAPIARAAPEVRPAAAAQPPDPTLRPGSIVNIRV